MEHLIERVENDFHATCGQLNKDALCRDGVLGPLHPCVVGAADIKALDSLEGHHPLRGREERQDKARDCKVSESERIGFIMRNFCRWQDCQDGWPNLEVVQIFVKIREKAIGVDDKAPTLPTATVLTALGENATHQRQRLVGEIVKKVFAILEHDYRVRGVARGG